MPNRIYYQICYSNLFRRIIIDSLCPGQEYYQTVRLTILIKLDLITTMQL